MIPLVLNNDTIITNKIIPPAQNTIGGARCLKQNNGNLVKQFLNLPHTLRMTARDTTAVVFTSKKANDSPQPNTQVAITL